MLRREKFSFIKKKKTKKMFLIFFFVGAGGVGKSSLVLRFIKGTFRESYIPTIEDTYRQVSGFLSKNKVSPKEKCFCFFFFGGKRDLDWKLCVFTFYFKWVCDLIDAVVMCYEYVGVIIIYSLRL